MSTNKTLLIAGDYPIIASPTLAKAYGLAAATFLQKLHYFLQKNDAVVYQERRYWFHSYEQWTHSIGFYSISTIKRVIRTLKHAGLLLIEKLSAKKWLQINYYSIDYQKLEQLFDFTELPVKDASAVPYQKHSIEEPTETPARAPSPAQLKPSNLALAVPTEASTASLQGNPEPGMAGTNTVDLNNLPSEIRHFYLDLQRLRVDIHPSDDRIHYWLPFARTILRHAAYVKEIAGGIERYQWHNPEQLGLEHFTYQNQGSG